MESTNRDVSCEEQTSRKGGESTPLLSYRAFSVQGGHLSAQLRSVAESQAPTLPSLQMLLEAVSYMPGHIRFGRRNDERRSPIAKALTSLYGGTWTVSAQAIRWLIGSGKNERLWEWRTPEDYALVLSGIDGPDWKEGQPQRTIKIEEFATALRCVIARAEEAHEVASVRREKRGSEQSDL